MGEYRDTNRNVTGGRVSAALAIADTIKRELPATLRQVREPAKVIAFRAGIAPRTVEAIRQEEHGISAASLLALAKTYPAVKKLVLRLIDAETGESGEYPAAVIEQIRKLVSGAA